MLQFYKFLILAFCASLTSYNQIAQDKLEAKTLLSIEEAKKEYSKIKDYKGLIISSEKINGKQRKTEFIKTYYLKGGNIYLKWLPGGLYEGMQASYLPSRDGKDCFMSKETGIKGVIGVKKWCNDDYLVRTMYPHHFTIQQTSLGDVFTKIQYILIKGQKLNKISVEEYKETIDKFSKKAAVSVIVKLSDNPKDGLMWSKVHLYFDKETKLPFHFITYDFNGQKLGEYAYIKLNINTGLTLEDFKIK